MAKVTLNPEQAKSIKDLTTKLSNLFGAVSGITFNESDIILITDFPNVSRFVELYNKTTKAEKEKTEFELLEQSISFATDKEGNQKKVNGQPILNCKLSIKINDDENILKLDIRRFLGYYKDAETNGNIINLFGNIKDNINPIDKIAHCFLNQVPIKVVSVQGYTTTFVTKPNELGQNVTVLERDDKGNIKYSLKDVLAFEV